MAPLGAFLPIDRRLALATGTSLPERADGAVLFADIAGFTPLTESLTRELGPQRGPEELTHCLNRVYGALVEAIHRYRGSVISFGGDAITCWFPGDDGWRAVTSAAALHAAMGEWGHFETPAGTGFDLAIKVAIAVGPVRRLVVGDPALRRLDVIAGRTLDAMALAEKSAHQDETVLTAAAAAALGERVIVGDWRSTGPGQPLVAPVRDLRAAASPAPWPAAAHETVDAREARNWLWPAVHERLEHLRGGMWAELRPAVAMFLHFEGIDCEGDPAAQAKLDTFVRAVEAVLDQHGGTLLELSFGDKGSHAYAAFGAPAAHTDDSSQAMGAALDLLALAQQELAVRDLRIGLARGPMRTGAYGSAGRATYSVMGDRTNLAARLMAAARPGEVLCDDAVRDAAGRHWAMEALTPIRVKGKAEPVAVFHPTGARTATIPAVGVARGTLLGREAELARLEAALAEARADGQCVVGIVGDGGIGKSRLVAEAVARVRAAGLRCSLGAGQSIEQHTPYRAWRDVLADGLDLTEIEDPAGRRQRVETWLGANTPELLDRVPLLSDILGLGWAENSLTSGLDPALRRESLADLVTGILREWGRTQPCLVVLDDAQWLDDLSWQLVVDVARVLAVSRTPLLMILALRPPDATSPVVRYLERLAELGSYRRLALDALAPAATVAVAAQRLGVVAAALPEPVAELIRDRAEGNPFVAEELALALRDQGTVRVEMDPAAPEAIERRRCRVVGDLDAAGQALPTDVQGLVLARIDRLSVETQTVLKMAAVIGRTFALPVLEYALDETGEQPHLATTNALQQLLEHDLTLLEATQPVPLYAFNHIITQETAYSTLLFQQRRGMHRVVAGWYEQQYGAGEAPPPEDGLPSLEPHYPLLAHHYQRAEEPGREQVYARLAGEQAAGQYANVAALRYLGRALELADAGDDAARYRVLVAREAVYDRLGEREEQAADIAAMATIADGADQASWGPYVALRRANLSLVHGDYDGTKVVASQCVASARELGDNSMATQGLIMLGKAAWQQGQFDEARGALGDALSHVDCACQQRDAAECWLNLGAVERHQLNFVASWRYFELALAAYRDLGDRQGEAGCLTTLAAIAGELGDFATAQRRSEQALALCRMIGHRRGLSIIEGNVAADRFDLGDYSGARVHLELALVTCRELGDRWGEATNQDTLGLVRHRQGELVFARDEITAALTIDRSIGNHHEAGYALTHLGDVALDLGDPAAALAAHEEALTIRQALGQAALAMDNRCGLARVALARGDRDAARQQVVTALAWIEEHGTEGMEFPVLAEWTCYQVLDLLAAERPDDGPRALAALERAHALVQARAQAIADDETRRGFLENVPFNQAVEAAWAAAASPVLA